MAQPHLPRLLDALYAQGASHYDQVGQTWWVSRPDAVHQVLTDDALSAAHGGSTEQPPVHTPILVGMQASTGRRHDDLRGAVAPRLHRNVLGRPRYAVTHTIAAGLVDRIVTRRTGQADLVAEFARPFAAHVMCLVMGLAQEATPNVWRWLDEQVDNVDPTDPTPTWERQWASWFALLAERRAEPPGDADGLVDYLLKLQESRYTRVDGRRMTDDDIAACCTTLLAVGAATVAAGIATTVAYLNHADLVDAVRTQPALTRAAVREAVRCEPPMPTLLRRARTDVEVDGQRIPAGEWVTASLLAASRDPDRWSDPDAFRLDRPEGESLAFGLGKHRCPAEEFATIQLQVGLRALLGRLPGLRVEPTAALRRRWPALAPGLVDLPVRFDADAAVAPG
jgi:cytochrome P450